MAAKGSLLTSGAGFLTGAGKTILSTLGLMSKGGAIGTLNPATGALVPSSGFMGGAVGSLLTNPWTVAAGAGLLATKLWINSQAHRKANEWTQGVQTEWGDNAIAFMQDLERRQKVGSLTYDEAVAAQQHLESNVTDLWTRGSSFSSRGKQQATVITQAHQKLDPIIEGWRKTLQGYVEGLQSGASSTSTGGTAPPSLPTDMEDQANAAAERQRKKALGMKGRQSTLLTGPKGLMDLPTLRPRTLLAGGYR